MFKHKKYLLYIVSILFGLYINLTVNANYDYVCSYKIGKCENYERNCWFDRSSGDKICQGTRKDYTILGNTRVGCPSSAKSSKLESFNSTETDLFRINNSFYYGSIPGIWDWALSNRGSGGEDLKSSSTIYQNFDDKYGTNTINGTNTVTCLVKLGRDSTPPSLVLNLNSREANCTGLPNNARWNTISKILQTKDGENYIPSNEGVYSETGSTNSCVFKCNNGFIWNGTSCISYTYSWKTSDWGECSKSCGGGEKTRTINCSRSDGIIVTDSFCSNQLKQEIINSCNTQECLNTGSLNTSCINGTAQYSFIDSGNVCACFGTTDSCPVGWKFIWTQNDKQSYCSNNICTGVDAYIY